MVLNISLLLDDAIWLLILVVWLSSWLTCSFRTLPSWTGKTPNYVNRSFQLKAKRYFSIGMTEGCLMPLIYMDSTNLNYRKHTEDWWENSFFTSRPVHQWWQTLLRLWNQPWWCQGDVIKIGRLHCERPSVQFIEPTLKCTFAQINEFSSYVCTLLLCLHRGCIFNLPAWLDSMFMCGS